VIRLSFQPALDPLHAVFRLLRLHALIRRLGSLEIDQIRILDFYLIFPFRIAEIRLRREHVRFRKIAAPYGLTKPYGFQPEDRVLFERMRPIQWVALEALAAKGFISSSDLEKGLVRFTERPIPTELMARIDEANYADKKLFEVLELLVSEYPLHGVDGLKARSGLLEFRYDAA